MPFIPNEPTAAFAAQSYPDSVDFDIILAGPSGHGVKTGCAVTAQGSPDNTVAVSAGTMYWAWSEVVVTGGNLTMTAAHGTNPRFDLITVTNAGVKTYTVGTAAAAPVFPAIPANSVVLAAIYVPATDNVINASQIIDKRVMLSPPVSVGWTTVPKVVSDTTQSDNTLTNDDEIQFAMAANTKYRIRGFIAGKSTANADFKYALSGPATPTVVIQRAWHFFEGGTMGDTTMAASTGYFGPQTISFGTAAVVIVEFELVVHNAGNAGTFAFQWAAAASVAEDTTVYAGSYLEYAVV